MKYCDYVFYRCKYSGTLPESVFNRLSIEASVYINKHTFGRIDKDNLPDEVKYCTCSLVDKISKIQKRQGKKSEEVGSWSITYVESKEDKALLEDTLKDYLSPKLLYRGL